MSVKKVTEWLFDLVGEHVAWWGHTKVDEVTNVAQGEGNELLLTTDDGEYVQTWIISVRPTVRACEVANRTE